MRTGKSSRRKSTVAKESAAGKNPGGRLHKAYGDTATICVNARCTLRKAAPCYGFEGCPGFKGK